MNYRGITVSCLTSKLFEICLLEMCKSYLYTSETQFRFKANMGCRDAILTAELATNYFTLNGATVTLCNLDVSKAFDRVNIYCLLNKLITRGMPYNYIKLLYCWFSKCYVSVKWGDSLSSPFYVRAGVRQGGVLSPLFFSVYVDDLIVKLRNSGLGIYVKGVFLGAIVYADDILLMSCSMLHMQKMLNICVETLCSLDLFLNISKCTATRIGPRYAKHGAPLVIHSNALVFVKETKYLGTYITSGCGWRNNFRYNRATFYKVFNAILSKCAASNSELAWVQLLTSICIPVILYAVEACAPSRSDMLMLDGIIDNAFRKIFNINDAAVIAATRSFLNVKGIYRQYWMSKCKFFISFNKIRSPLRSCLTGLLFDELRVQLVENNVELRVPP